MGAAYTQAPPYIPAADAAFRDWLGNFAALLSADPARYGVSIAEAAIIADAAREYDAAYQTAQAPATRTSVTIARKEALRTSATGSARALARLIKASGDVADEDKLALGIHIDDPTRSPIPAPTSRPLLMLVAAFSGVHSLRYADEHSPASRRKARGALQMQLNLAVAPGAVTDPGESRLFGLYTRQPILVEHDPAHAAQTATYFARWVTRSGKFGPWSLPTSMTIAFGGPAAASPMGRRPAGGEEQLAIAA